MLDDLLQCLSLVATGVNIYLTIGVFMYKNQAIAELAQSIGSFHQFPKPMSFDRANRLANFVTDFMAIYTILGTLFFGFISFMFRDDCLKENIELSINRICGPVSPIPLPEYFNNSPYVEMLSSFILFNCILLCVATAVILTFICGLVIVIISRIRHFKAEVHNAFEISSKHRRIACLKYSVRYHVHIINLIRKLNACISTASLLQATFTAAVIAMVAFQFSMKPELKTALLGFGWFMVLSILCYAGQALIDETSDLSEHIYNTNWYNYEVETQKFVYMFIVRGNHFLFIDTMFLGPLGLTTFAFVSI